MFKSLFQPNLYHGKTPWNKFEGWYFKITNKEASETFAFIPGVFWGDNKSEAHGFLQVLEGSNGIYTYHRFPTSLFKPSSSPFLVELDNNKFSLDEIKLSINSAHQKIRGFLRFSNLIDWQDHFYSPGSMGYFNFIPFMQCYSQVCAMKVDLSGELLINDTIYNFDGGKGYIEKNWGNAFPLSWIWIQSNNFQHTETSLSCSVAHIPFWFTSFRGFLVGLYHQNKLYPFTTMSGATIGVKEMGKDVVITLADKDYILNIRTESDTNSFILCNGPRNGRMVPLVEESLTGRVYIQLLEKATNNILLEDVGFATGIEYGGEQMKIFDV